CSGAMGLEVAGGELEIRHGDGLVVGHLQNERTLTRLARRLLPFNEWQIDDAFLEIEAEVEAGAAVAVLLVADIAGAGSVEPGAEIETQLRALIRRGRADGAEFLANRRIVGKGLGPGDGQGYAGEDDRSLHFHTLLVELQRQGAVSHILVEARLLHADMLDIGGDRYRHILEAQVLRRREIEFNIRRGVAGGVLRLDAELGRIAEARVIEQLQRRGRSEE